MVGCCSNLHLSIHCSEAKGSSPFSLDWGSHLVIHVLGLKGGMVVESLAESYNDSQSLNV